MEGHIEKLFKNEPVVDDLFLESTEWKNFLKTFKEMCNRTKNILLISRFRKEILHAFKKAPDSVYVNININIEKICSEKISSLYAERSKQISEYTSRIDDEVYFRNSACP